MSLVSRMSFKFKLILLCLFMASVSIVIGGMSYFGLQRVAADYEHIHDVIMPDMKDVQKMLIDFKDVQIYSEALGLPENSPEEKQKAISAVDFAIKDFEKVTANYEAAGLVGDEKALFEKVKVAWEDYRKVVAKILVFEKSGTPEDYQKIIKLLHTESPETADAFSKEISALLNFQDNESERYGKMAESKSSESNTLILITIAMGLLVGLSVGVIFARVVSNSILGVASQLSENVIEVSSASTQIAASSQELSQAATEQAASLQETSSAVEELSSMVNRNAENAKNTASSTAESQEKASEGQQVVGRMISSMDEINQSNESIMNQINDSNRQMFEVVKVIQEIGNKTKVINDIVFQTKLLSFNASVEAARAGEHGKGFAVVAEEVGNLAQMSGNAAKEISAMLDGSIHKVETLVNETKTRVEQLSMVGKQKIENGVDVAKRCGEILNEIVGSSSSISNMASEISSASQEQSQGIGEINKAMNQLDQVTQQNAAASGETASAAEKLSAQSVSLKSSVDGLMKLILGAGATTHTVSSKSHEQSGKSKVVRMHSKSVKHPSTAPNKSVPQQASHEFKVASGDSSVPNRNDPGFSE